MGIPGRAKKEAVLPGGVVIYDVSKVLPKPTRPRYNQRPDGTKIVRVFFHHSAAYGKDGYQGAENSVKYVIRERNFGARPYHFWLARKPDTDADGNLVIYRLGQDDERCWHTGGRANEEGIGVVWQGDLYPDEDGEPTEAQYKMAEALTNWLIKRHELSLPDGLSFHAEADRWGGSKKPSCPGPFVQEWVKERRQRKEEEKPSLDPATKPKEPVEKTPPLVKKPDSIWKKIYNSNPLSKLIPWKDRK
jgi:hypothetical protein